MDNAVKDELAIDECWIVEKENLVEAIKSLGYNVLIDIAGVDYLGMENHKGKRFAVIYCLKNTKNMARVRIKVQVEENEKIPTLSKIYPIANWQEREVWDQFGIVFDEHPNLKRLLNHADFEGHPLRKDYPAKKRQWLSENDQMQDQLEKRLETLGYRVL
ncbi:NADH-quinone oxidoreductase subunit 5 [Fibrobacteria bacterium R8-3-H12]